MKYIAPKQSIRIPSLVTMPVNLYSTPTTEAVEFEVTTYEFPKIDASIRLSFEVYREMVNNAGLTKAICDHLWRSARNIIEGETKVNGVSGYGVLSAEIVE